MRVYQKTFWENKISDLDASVNEYVSQELNRYQGKDVRQNVKVVKHFSTCAVPSKSPFVDVRYTCLVDIHVL